MKIFFAFLSLVFIGCSANNSNESFELTLQSCYEMKADKNHRYWKQPIAVQAASF